VLPDVKKGNNLMLTRLTPVATLVTSYLRQSVRCDVLGQRSPNHGPRRRLSIMKKNLRKTCWFGRM